MLWKIVLWGLIAIVATGLTAIMAVLVVYGLSLVVPSG